MWEKYYFGIDGPFNNGGKIIFSKSVLRLFYHHRQLENTDTESGGVLLGYYRGKHFDVKFISQPQEEDSQLPLLFERNSAYHCELALKLWKKSKGKVFYLGEWHTHYQDSPQPSMLDINEWLKIWRIVQRPLLFVIVGIQSIWVGGIKDLTKIHTNYSFLSQ